MKMNVSWTELKIPFPATKKLSSLIGGGNALP
jgi:hypothetical protein